MILNHKAFQIEDDYGGRQQWLSERGFTSKFWADRSCGVAAAANLMTYLGREYGDLQELYNGNTKQEYIDLMEELYGFLKPRIFGIPTLGKMGKGLTGFAKSRGIEMMPCTKTWLYDVKDGSRFIRGGLAQGLPVLLLTWNYSDKELQNHWVTVTGWDVVYGEEYMTVSNWGKKKVYSYDNWASNRSLLKGALYLSRNKCTDASDMV
ncbi:MAG: hypothetical protein ACQEP4_08015 [Bacillota bacterium]